MASIQTTIPAFPLWKMLHETLIMPDVFKKEESVNRLVAIMKSNDFENVFVMHKDSTSSFVEYEKLMKIYRSFTLWVLGRFLFAMSNVKSSKIQETLIDVQKYILLQMSRTQANVHHELLLEYGKALEIPIKFSIDNNNVRVVEVFKPEHHEELSILDLSPIFVEITSKNACVELIVNIMRILEEFLPEYFALHCIDQGIINILHNLLLLLCKSTICIKLKILEIYGKIVEKLQLQKDFDETITKILEKFHTYFECILIEIYDQNIVLTQEQFAVLENIIQIIYLNFEYIKNGDLKIKNLTQFLYDIIDSHPKISDKLFKILIEHFEKLEIDFNINDFLVKHINLLNYNKICIIKNTLKKEILNYCSTLRIAKEIEVYKHSKLWNKFNEIFMQTIENATVDSKKIIVFFNEISVMLLKITFEVRNELVTNSFWTDITLIYFKETKILRFLLLNSNYDCKCFVNLVILSNTKNLDVIFTLIAYPHLIPVIYTNEQQMPCQIIGTGNNTDFKNIIQTYYKKLNVKNMCKLESLKNVRHFFEIISSGLLQNLNENHVNNIQNIFLKICKNATNNDEKIEIIKTIPHILSIFPRSEAFLYDVFIPSLHEESIGLKISGILLCTSHSDYLKLIRLDNFEIEILCEKCDLKIRNSNEKNGKIQKLHQQLTGYYTLINFCRNKYDFTSKDILNKCIGNLSNVDVLDILPKFANHLENFNLDIAKIWIELMGNNNVEIREKFAEIILQLLHNIQENSTDTKGEYLNLVLDKLLELVPKSLKFSNFPLQKTLLNTIRSLIKLKSQQSILPLFKILLVFVMIPTSKYAFLATNSLVFLAETHKKVPLDIYVEYTKQICETIAHLCAINQCAVDYNLRVSLKKILFIFDCSQKEFLTCECQYLLPFFVAKLEKMPKVDELIEEIAVIMDVDLPELLVGKYGYIFIHTFLNENSNVYKISMAYLEKTTGLDGSNLRRKNLKFILSNLLLHFHKKNRDVILALHLLMKDDTDQITDVPQYLQSHFLGVLIFFIKTLLKKSNNREEILESLSDIFQFMGKKHITPLRFKIISMLQTVNFEKYPNLVSNLWFTFLKTCDVEMLGPQLATIFKSLLPLLETCPNEINKIYKFLICKNETKLNEHIEDLFFIKNENVSPSILHKINEYVSKTENYDFKKKIKWLTKYLTHETVEIRVEGMRGLKKLLEENREELDSMILGYNGIDESIVEIIDVLMLSCREKDVPLKLACAEVIGELGALEPSHLPRRYAHDTRAFSFFIYEDNFIINALHELIRALQAEKNAVNMDRTSLAIQEILKTNDISPNVHSGKHSIWKQFSESQQELMKPLLYSRYISTTNSLNLEYRGHNHWPSSSTSFQLWLYSWASVLISKVPSEKRVFLEGCLPSMREGERILMHFLPHILLHAIIDGNAENDAYDKFQAVLCFNDQSDLDYSILNTVIVPLPGANTTSQPITPTEFWKNKCTKIIFILFDFLDRWLREWKWLKQIGGKNNPNFQIVQNFLKRFCKLQLAKSNYRCGEYPRALMFLEDFITENPREVSENLSFLAEIYSQLGESDGVTGTMALRQTEPTIQDRILALEVSGKLADAAACYECINPPLKLQHLQGLVQCYLDSEFVNTALSVAYAAMSTHSDYDDVLLDMQAEPLWRLGRFDMLENLLEKPEIKNNKSWGVQIGKALIHFNKDQRNEFKNILDLLKLQQVDLLGATSLEEGAYQHGYSYICRLHVLNELKQVYNLIQELLVIQKDDRIIQNVINKFKHEWELRIKVVQESVRTIQPILCLRRVMLGRGIKLIEKRLPNALPFLNSLLGESWLLSAKTARSARVHQQAYTYMLKAEEYGPPDLFIEKARLHWLREENEEALTTLERGLTIFLPTQNTQNIEAMNLEQRKLCAEAKLLIATYNDSTSNAEADVILQTYKDAYDICKEYEKSMVCLGQHYDKRFQSFADEERDTSKGSEIQIAMIKYFGHSLLYGSNYVYQSLPRLLSIWFDYGTRLLDVTQTKIREDRKTSLLKMTHLIDTCLQKLPAYIFLTAFSQLVSRICHPQREVYIQLKSIIIKLLLHYPQQTLWMMIPIIKSSYAMRAKRCNEIFNDTQIKNSSIVGLVRDFTNLAEKLIELCNKEIPSDVHTASVNSLLRSLPRMLNQEDFNEIMIPTHKFRKLVLPNPDFKNSGNHNPFPNQYVHIVGMKDEITLLVSQQRPRRITFRGSDGKCYIQMLKPKDDLRKDFRLMEFNDIVNQLLTRDAEARERRLNIRLYSVAPLNEECGLVEWVPNLIGLRPILLNLYNQNGFGVRNAELREMVAHLRDPLSKKRDIFVTKLLPRHPPILGEWFRKNFPDAQSWLTARTAFIRTTAVMSMVGYILGLGDRHGENILIDSTCGDIVHVDFNCLFNKGETLEFPERVPFRLTQNMVSAMGPLGVEGMFRKSCICTLGVLRTNTATLMSIVTPFVYDPLVSWPRMQQHTVSAERTNEQAVEHVKNIELRLKGVIKSRGRAQNLSPLSVEGQTNYLIKEAVSIDNLCQMYYGWGPFF